MFILFIPSIANFKNFITQKESNIQNFDVNVSVQFKNSFNLINDPFIQVANSDDTNISFHNQRALITEEGIYYRQFFFFGSVEKMTFEKNSNLADSEKFSASFEKTLIFLLPSLLFWGFLFFVVYFAIIILVTFVLGLIFGSLFRVMIEPLRMFKTSIYSATILIALQLILMPFYRLIWLPLIAYWLLFIIIIFLLKDETVPHGKSRVFTDSKADSKRNIFSNSKNDSDYDSDDERPALKKKKKSYEEENDGYVEMK